MQIPNPRKLAQQTEPTMGYTFRSKLQYIFKLNLNTLASSVCRMILDAIFELKNMHRKTRKLQPLVVILLCPEL